MNGRRLTGPLGHEAVSSDCPTMWTLIRLAKLRLDFPRRVSLGLTVDADTRELIVWLCTRAGMIFEDASTRALNIFILKPDVIAKKVEELHRSTQLAAAILGAAQALIDSQEVMISNETLPR